MLSELEKPIVEYMEKKKRETAMIHPSEAVARMEMIVDEAADRFKHIQGISRERIKELFMKEF